MKLFNINGYMVSFCFVLKTAKLSNPEKYAEDIKSGKLYKAHDRTNKSLEEKLYEWEVLHTRLDDLI